MADSTTGVYSATICIPNLFEIKGNKNKKFSTTQLTYKLDHLKDAIKAYMYASDIKFRSKKELPANKQKDAYNLNKFVSELFEKTFNAKYSSSKLRNDSQFGQLLIKVPELFIDLDKKGFLAPKKYTDASMKFSEEFEKDGKKLSLYVPYSPLNMTHQEVQFDVGPESERNNPRATGNNTVRNRSKSPTTKRVSPRRKASRGRSGSARQRSASPRRSVSPRRQRSASPRRNTSPRGRRPSPRRRR